MEDVIERMRHDVSFERIGDSSAFHVRFRYGDAEQALAETPIGPESHPHRGLGPRRGTAARRTNGSSSATPPRYGSSRKFTEIVVTTSTGWPFSSVG
jgi:hypothetical protein